MQLRSGILYLRKNKSSLQLNTPSYTYFEQPTNRKQKIDPMEKYKEEGGKSVKKKVINVGNFKCED